MGVSNNVLLVEKVYMDIRNKILSGEYPSGMHLVEAELTKEFKVSRVTMREASRRLVVDDLVDLIPNSGVRVRRLSYQDVIDLYAVREPLEALAARLAAQAPPDKLKDLQMICSEGAAATARRDRINHRFLNNQFHLTLAAVTGNRTLVRVLERLNLQIVASQFMSFMRDEDFDISQHDHEELLKAIFAGYSDKAELIMRLHIKKGREFALSCLPRDLNNSSLLKQETGQ